MESKRQRQVGRVVQQYLSEIFLKEGKEITGSAMVTISQVKMSPDLFVARVYLSIYNTEHPDEIMHYIESNTGAFRKILGNKIRHQVRSVPTIQFFKDETLDEVFKLEEIFKELKEEREKKNDPDKSE